MTSLINFPSSLSLQNKIELGFSVQYSTEAFVFPQESLASSILPCEADTILL